MGLFRNVIHNITDSVYGSVLYSACLATDLEVVSSIPGTSTNFKCLERSPPSLVKRIEQLLDREVVDIIKKVDIIRLANHINPPYCH